MAQQTESNLIFKTHGNLNSFINEYKHVASNELLIAIWNFGNDQYSKGYNDGYHGFDDTDESDS
jgi:hypothetical protein